MFKINNDYFEIEQAFIDGQLDDEEEKVLILGIEISAKKVDDYTQPSITSETLLKIKEGEIKNGKILLEELLNGKNIQKIYGNRILNFIIGIKNIERKFYL